VLLQGTIRYGEDGQPEGIEIEIEKFSTFTVIRTVPGEDEAVHIDPYISGYPDGTFWPGQAMTRAEVSAMLARSLVYRSESATADGKPQSSVQYADVAPGHWASEAIARMREEELTFGDEAGRFRPSDVITRAEMAAIAERWHRWIAQDAAAGYADTAGHWAEDVIAAAQSEGIMNGYPDGTFRPAAPLLRAEAVRILNAVYGRPVPVGSGTTIWPDVATSHWPTGISNRHRAAFACSRTAARKCCAPRRSNSIFGR